MIGSRRRIVYCKQARQPDSRQSGNKFYKAYKRNKLLRAFSLLKDTQPELRISSKITVQRVFNLPGFPHNQTRTIFSSHCRAMGRTEYNLERNTSRYFSKALHSKFQTTCVKSSPTCGIRNKGLAYTLHPAARAPWIVAAQIMMISSS